MSVMFLAIQTGSSIQYAKVKLIQSPSVVIQIELKNKNFDWLY